MDLHEYQAKKILKEYGLKIPPFGVASSIVEVEELLQHLKLKSAVLKIQVHAGGRGKAGGVKLVSGKDIIIAAKSLLGMKMVNKQTGPEGIVAEKILMTEPVDIDKEYYLCAAVDREISKPVLIASQEGGMDIEEVAKAHPEKILKIPIELSGVIRPFHLLRLVKFMGWKDKMAQDGTHIAEVLAKVLLDKDATLVEINPLVASTGDLLVLDAKMSIDEDALFRQPKLATLYDASQLSKTEREAKSFGLSYVAMEGDIGCMVNGAGLAMATMDLIYRYGGTPANFLDVGGGASKEKVAEGFKIILQDQKVKGILVNIFGGIMDCAVLAEGIIEAAKECAIRVPLVVRMEGTNVDVGRSLLDKSGLAIISARSLQEAAEKIICAVKK